MSGFSEPGELNDRGEIRRRLRRASHDMLGLEIKDSLELEILSILVDGPRTPAELVDIIFKYSRSDPDYMTYYTKTRRALQKLASKGYVSRKLFGSAKPYRMTDYGYTRLTNYASGKNPPRVLPQLDKVLHSATIILACFLLLSVSGRIRVPGQFLISLNSIFFFSTGLSVARIMAGIRRIL